MHSVTEYVACSHRQYAAAAPPERLPPPRLPPPGPGLHRQLRRRVCGVIENESELSRHPRRQADRRLFFSEGVLLEMYPGELGFLHRSSCSRTVQNTGQTACYASAVPSLPAAEGTNTQLYAPPGSVKWVGF
jgi:hypothetical protein